jgi:predicted RNA-binding protein with PIN domain
MKEKNIKPKEYLFVDGYNIINSWDNLRKLSDVSLETARNELIEIMSEYQQYTGIKVIVVFDAHLLKGSIGRKEIINKVEIVYTKEGETADQYIERTLDRIGRIKKIRVATSDWMEQQVVLGRGGTRISARELQAEIFDEKKILRKKSVKANERNDWLMGRLDEETLKRLKNWRNDE